VHALTLSGIPTSPYQVGNTAQVRTGLVVVAGTNLPGLTAGGSYNATCVSPHTSFIRASRELSSTQYFKYNQLYVTVPEWVPDVRNMPGFESIDRGQTIQCVLDWEAHARESIFSIGIPGSSIPIGGEQGSTGSSISFSMNKPGTATGDDDACIP
jgi:hypothetical protein